MKDLERDCPYNPSDLVSNLERVSSWKKTYQNKRKTQWKPPPLRTSKWNVDGSSKGKPGLAGIGGILRDDKAHGLSKFVALAGVRDSNEAEFLVVFP